MKNNNLLFLLLLLIFGCEAEVKTPQLEKKGSENSNEGFTEKSKQKLTWNAPEFSFSYQLDRPDETFKLPNKLAEISGLSLSTDGQFLLAVNDEKGKIYFLNKKSGSIEKEEKYAKDGDFEGVESVGDQLFMVESNGKIRQITKEDGKTNERTIETPLRSSNNVEGMGYDAKNNYLLLACKGKPEIDKKKYKNQRAVYAYDLKEDKLIKEPILLFHRDTIEHYLKQPKRLVDGVIKLIAPDQASDAFAPSGIAQHPVTGELYVISSIGKLLMVVHPSGKILYIEKLDTTYHKQPEGICFDKDGTLYISTEGRGGKGKIYQFVMK